MDDKKKRKAYTITKPRESWSDEEHARFLEALSMYERDWKRIEEYVQTKSVIQIRSHAQKYFIKMQKQGRYDCIPPPRPKKRSSKTYPKTTETPKRSRDSDNFSSSSPGSSYSTPKRDSHPVLTTPQPVNRPNSWTPWERQQMSNLQHEQFNQAQFYLQQAIDANSAQEAQEAAPNFQRIYSFLGSLFDPSSTGHMQDLQCMSETDRKVVQLLMQNLSSNLSKHSGKFSSQGSGDAPSCEHNAASEGHS